MHTTKQIVKRLHASACYHNRQATRYQRAYVWFAQHGASPMALRYLRREWRYHNGKALQSGWLYHHERAPLLITT